MSFRRTQAKAVLAALFFIHLFQRVIFFWRKRRGLPKFLANFSADGIGVVSPAEREGLALDSRCIACSLCTFSCTKIAEGTAPPQFEPKLLLLGFGRSAHEAEYATEDWLPCLECGSCTVVCPTHAPVHAAAERIRERRLKIRFRS